MRLALLFSLLLVGCGASPEPTQEHSSTTPSESYSYDDPTGGDNTMPCDKPSFVVLMVNGEKVVTEVPSLCQQNFGPDKGDPPPDYAGDPNPWDKSTIHILNVHINEHEAQGNASR